jgi:hypothetical protein
MAGPAAPVYVLVGPPSWPYWAAAGRMVAAGVRSLMTQAPAAAGAGAAIGVASLPGSTPIEQAQTGAQARDQAGTDTCVTKDCDGRDPCKGLRDQLQQHRQKLRDYQTNPYAHDNKGFLGQGRDEQIIASRIASLERQIRNFEEQLKKCEEANGKR